MLIQGAGLVGKKWSAFGWINAFIFYALLRRKWRHIPVRRGNRGNQRFLSSWMDAVTFAPFTRSFATVTGSLNRLGPALPGLTWRTPLKRSILGLCE